MGEFRIVLSLYHTKSRLFQYTGGYKNVYIAPTLCFMLLDGAVIFRETKGLAIIKWK